MWLRRPFTIARLWSIYTTITDLYTDLYSISFSPEFNIILSCTLQTVGGGGGVNVSGVGAAEMVAVGPDYFRFPEQLPAQYHEMMRSWLMHRGSCPVEFTWMDLGKSFWPRWIKQGRCGPSESASCSWPPGMSCTSSSVKVLNLLRWHCW